MSREKKTVFLKSYIFQKSSNDNIAFILYGELRTSSLTCFITWELKYAPTLTLLGCSTPSLRSLVPTGALPTMASLTVYAWSSGMPMTLIKSFLNSLAPFCFNKIFPFTFAFNIFFLYFNIKKSPKNGKLCSNQKPTSPLVHSFTCFCK